MEAIGAILSEAYAGHSGADARTLCGRLGIRLCPNTMDSRPFHATYLPVYAVGDILLPPRADEAREAFLIFHELGHHFLRVHGGICGDGALHYWTVEYACDRFAIVMLLASCGLRSVPPPDAAFFLQAGEKTRRALNRRSAALLRELCDGTAERGLKPALKLADDLDRHADSLPERE
jgi:hypothetical protein